MKRTRNEMPFGFDYEKLRRLWADGESIKDIARQLGITPTTLGRLRTVLRLPRKQPARNDGVIDPTPDEIAQRSAEVRAGWPTRIAARRQRKK